MKSGSLRANAGAAEIHHRLRHVELDDDAAAEPLRNDIGDRRQLGLGRQRAEGAVEQPARGLGIDVADDRDLEGVARQHAAGIGLEIVDGDASAPIRACR